MRQLQLHSNPIAVSGSGHSGKQINSFDAVIHKQEKSASHAVLSKMKLTLHAIRRTPHGASRLVLATSAWSVETRRAPSGHRRTRVYGQTTTAMHDNEYTVLPNADPSNAFPTPTSSPKWLIDRTNSSLHQPSSFREFSEEAFTTRPSLDKIGGWTKLNPSLHQPSSFREISEEVFTTWPSLDKMVDRPSITHYINHLRFEKFLRHAVFTSWPSFAEMVGHSPH